MNESINLPKLIARMASSTGSDPAEVRRFLHQLFSLVEESLLAGEPVTIKGVGEFHPGTDPSQPVIFRPDDTLAAIANEPFAAFSPTELNDGVTPEMLADQPQVTAQPEPLPAPVPEVVDTVKNVVTEQIAESLQEEPQPQEESQPQEEPQEQPPIVPEVVPAPQEEPEPEPVNQFVEQQEYYEPEPQIVYVEKKGANVLWLLIGILAGLLLGLVGGYFAGKYMSQYMIGSDLAVEPVESVLLLDEDTDIADEVAPARETTLADGAGNQASTPEPAAAVDTKEQPATPAAKPVYDTVTRSRYLTTMARDHYGKKSYWVFIYQANPQLKDPNKIAPGTRVEIPARESFAESTEQATDEKAKRILNELSRRYNL